MAQAARAASAVAVAGVVGIWPAAPPRRVCQARVHRSAARPLHVRPARPLAPHRAARRHRAHAHVQQPAGRLGNDVAGGCGVHKLAAVAMVKQVPFHVRHTKLNSRRRGWRIPADGGRCGRQRSCAHVTRRPGWHVAHLVCLQMIRARCGKCGTVVPFHHVRTLLRIRMHVTGGALVQRAFV